MLKKSYSDFLFAQPSFLSGSARVLDLGGTFDRYNTLYDPDQAAIQADWQMVGSDLRSCFAEGIPVVAGAGE